jgi:hypothetical protein
MRRTQWRPFVEGSAQPVLSSQAHEAVGRDCSCIQQSTAENTLARPNLIHVYMEGAPVWVERKVT